MEGGRGGRKEMYTEAWERAKGEWGWKVAFWNVAGLAIKDKEGLKNGI